MNQSKTNPGHHHDLGRPNIPESATLSLSLPFLYN